VELYSHVGESGVDFNAVAPINGVARLLAEGAAAVSTGM
jgi:hypothetical protein